MSGWRAKSHPPLFLRGHGSCRQRKRLRELELGHLRGSRGRKIPPVRAGFRRSRERTHPPVIFANVTTVLYLIAYNRVWILASYTRYVYYQLTEYHFCQHRKENR